MATDWARYMHENRDVYDMYSDGGKWDWDNGRQQNAYMRADGTPLQQESAAQYAKNHYRNFGKREGRAIHDTGSTDYAALLRGSGGGGGAQAPSPQNNSMSALQQQVADLTQSISDSAESLDNNPVVDASQAMAKTVLSGFNLGNEDSKKKKSFLTPFGA